ncbi:hypothetical protein RRG08_000218 [Elysia crispata]|uniref:Uncharacterized protein n=1 Tax=Elysia crispata TaxID=231223 RepID=A0AAE1E6H2_9GAST|nr:hypothetical protein RRG08_000218 [Elysia crispata]
MPEPLPPGGVDIPLDFLRRGLIGDVSKPRSNIKGFLRGDAEGASLVGKPLEGGEDGDLHALSTLGKGTKALSTLPRWEGRGRGAKLPLKQDGCQTLPKGGFRGKSGVETKEVPRWRLLRYLRGREECSSFKTLSRASFPWLRANPKAPPRRNGLEGAKPLQVPMQWKRLPPVTVRRPRTTLPQGKARQRNPPERSEGDPLPGKINGFNAGMLESGWETFPLAEGQPSALAPLALLGGVSNPPMKHPRVTAFLWKGLTIPLSRPPLEGFDYTSKASVSSGDAATLLRKTPSRKGSASFGSPRFASGRFF